MGGYAASVVIPAHNEENVLARCLDGLRTGATEGDLEIVVVCNGCRDGTARVARAAGVRVLETGRANKAAALNLGDAAVRSFPRFYVDADVRVDGAALLTVARTLTAGDALAAAPRLTLDLTGTSRGVRAYYRIWTRLPYVTSDHVGSGIVGLSREGRSRFGRFPDAVADDYFLYCLFASGERRTCPDATFTVYPARSLASLVARRTRVDAGNLQMRALGVTPAGPGIMPAGAAAGPASCVRGPASGVHGPASGGWRSVVRADRALLPAAAVYLAVGAVARIRARRRVRRGGPLTWDRDESSRVSAGPPPGPATSEPEDET